MKKPNPFITLMQIGQTARYHTEVLLKPQDVAQHSYNMAWLLWKLADEAPSANLLMAALAHDGAERWLGDMPAPTKTHLGLELEFARLESTELERRVGFVWPSLTLREQILLSLADKLEGLLFCWREVRMGNNPLRECARNYVALVEEYLHDAKLDPAVRGDLSQLLKEIEDGCK